MKFSSWSRSRIFSRRLGMALLWTTFVVGVAITVNVIGIRFIGSIDGWQRWMQAHAGHFLVWRLCLYAGTASGWWWMRRRLRQREPSSDSRRRLLRTEIAAVAAIVLLEVRNGMG